MRFVAIARALGLTGALVTMVPAQVVKREANDLSEKAPARRAMTGWKAFAGGERNAQGPHVARSEDGGARSGTAG